MSASLPVTKEDKRQRLQMLANQGSIGYTQAGVLYINYCLLFKRTKLMGEKK